MKIRIKNPIWGVPITILNDLCSDCLLHFETPMRERERVRTESSESQTQQDGLEKWNVTQSSTDGKCTTESSFNVYRIIGLKRLTVNGKNKYVRILIKKT